VTARLDMTAAAGDGKDAWGHGTFLAGVIAGAGTLESSGRGVAPGAHIVSVKVLGDDGSGHISDVIEGIDWVIANRKRFQIDVINLSLGAPVEQSWRDDPVCQAIERAWRVNIVAVAAAGNMGKDANGTEVLGGITSPGNCPYAITAGAVNTMGTPYRSDDVMTTYSSRGPTAIDHLLKPDLLAPGNKVRSLLAPGAIIAQEYPEKVVGAGPDARLELSGTSVSAGVVSGAAALLLEARRNSNAEDIRALLQLGAEWLPGLGIIREGAGSLNVLASIDAMRLPLLRLDVEPESNSTKLAPDRRSVRARGETIYWTDMFRMETIYWTDGLIRGDTIYWTDADLRGTTIYWTDTDTRGDTIYWSDSIFWTDSVIVGD
jgi:serine protease AprX